MSAPEATICSAMRAFSSSDSAPEGRRDGARDDAPRVALEQAPLQQRQHLGSRPEQEVAQAVLLPRLDHERHQVGAGDAARATAAEAAHQPRHGRAVGEVQPRPPKRAHHRVAVLRRDDAVHPAQARVAAAAAANAAQHGRRRRLQVADEVVDVEDRARRPAVGTRSVSSDELLTHHPVVASAGRQAGNDLLLDPRVGARQAVLERDLRLPAEHLAQARVVGVAAAHALGAVDDSF